MSRIEYMTSERAYVVERREPTTPRPELPKIKKIACEYCGRKTSEELCPSCGAPTPAEIPKPFGSKDHAYINVRSGPGLKYPPVSFLEPGQPVDIYEERNGWIRIAEDDKWVSALMLPRFQ